MGEGREPFDAREESSLLKSAAAKYGFAVLRNLARYQGLLFRLSPSVTESLPSHHILPDAKDVPSDDKTAAITGNKVPVRAALNSNAKLRKLQVMPSTSNQST